MIYTVLDVTTRTVCRTLVRKFLENSTWGDERRWGDNIKIV
jgi:hypothetical protein